MTEDFLLQEFIASSKGRDIRINVVGDKAIVSMLRENKNDFRSNIALGGIGKVTEISQEFYDTAESCACILGLDYCGVDLLYGENDKPYVCEVNSNAFWGEISAVTGINVAKTYAEYIIKQIKGI